MTNASLTQPAFIGGLVLGVLSALPIISAGNLCCCLWVVSGGALAAYLLQQNQSTPITPGDGAIVGLLSGVIGAFVYLVISIPITAMVAPMEREMLQRFIENAGEMPPEFRDFLGRRMMGPLRLMFGFILMLVLGSVFATIGGLLGAVVFKKSPPAVAPPPSA